MSYITGKDFLDFRFCLASAVAVAHSFYYPLHKFASDSSLLDLFLLKMSGVNMEMVQTVVGTAVNIKENDKEFIVELAAPGMNKKDFHIDIDNKMLEIKVEREEEKVEKETDYTRKEYDYSSFYRAFDLPENVKEDKIKAEYNNGILKVHHRQDILSLNLWKNIQKQVAFGETLKVCKNDRF